MKKITLSLEVPITKTDISDYITEYITTHSNKAQTKFSCDLICDLISSVHRIDSKEEALSIIKNMQKILNLLENKFKK